MTEFVLKDYSSSAALTITLNSLAIGGLALSTTVINNTSTNRFDEIEIEVIVGSLAATGNAIDGWLIPSRDGTNFQTIAGGTAPVGSRAVPQSYAWVDSGTSAKRAILRFVQLGPFHYRPLLRNGLGVAWPASGCTATWRGSVRETR